MRKNPRIDMNIGGFGTTAVGLSRSPLGIIALFIVLIYGFAALVLGFGSSSLADTSLKQPLVWFLVLFPVVVILIFSWLVAKHHEKLYAPSDFREDGSFLELQRKVDITSRKVDVLEDVSPVKISATPAIAANKHDFTQKSKVYSDDPQKGRWGGKREQFYRVIRVSPIKPLRSDPDYYRVPIEVCSTDPDHHPLSGRVTFYLHDTFDPDLEIVPVRDGVARLEVVSYGAFTVGARTEDGVTLELDLADPDINAPERFKQF